MIDEALVRSIAWRVYRQTGGRVPLDDLRQVARIAAWQAEQSFDPALGVPLDAWVRLKARGACVDLARSWWVMCQMPDVNRHASRLDDADQMATDDRRALLLLAIEHLSPRQRRLVQRFYLQGRRAVDLKESHQLLQKARQRMRQYLQGAGYDLQSLL